MQSSVRVSATALETSGQQSSHFSLTTLWPLLPVVPGVTWKWVMPHILHCFAQVTQSVRRPNDVLQALKPLAMRYGKSTCTHWHAQQGVFVWFFYFIFYLKHALLHSWYRGAW